MIRAFASASVNSRKWPSNFQVVSLRASISQGWSVVVVVAAAAEEEDAIVCFDGGSGGVCRNIYR